MSEVKSYYVTEAGLVEGEALGRISVVLRADFDRVTAERDDLKAEVADARSYIEFVDAESAFFKKERDSLQSELTKAKGLFREVLGVRHDDCLVGRIEKWLAHVTRLQADKERLEIMVNNGLQANFDIRKERDALQVLLTSADERADVLERDKARIDWLAEQPVDTLYLDDGRIIDIAGRVDLRDAIDAAMAAPSPSDDDCRPDHADANEPPCSACFARGCNGECMENL